MSAELGDILRDLIGKERLPALAISANGFAFDPRSGQSFTVNHTGVDTVELLLANGSVENTVAELAKRYDVPGDVVLGAVEVFIRQLARYLA
ncbi:MAG: PqqD family protein [Magnetococcales bacterium]|nr:PqqD family protein [Magnetococcales bacterium]MBF0322889.1 PqqD family protein [Magnetococcales bacterium]